MAEQSLSNGHVFKFKRENSNLILTEASDHSHENVLFGKGITISGSINSIHAHGIVQITNYDASPALKIQSGGTGGDGVIGFYGAGQWIMGQEQGVDEFRIANSSAITGTKALTINSSNDVSIPNGAIKTNELSSYSGDQITMAGNTKFKWTGAGTVDVISIGQSQEDFTWIKWHDNSDGDEQAAWIGHHAGQNKFTIKIKDEGGDNIAYYYNFKENGDAIFPGNITVTSDARLKKNISNLDNSLEKIKLLRGVKFNWNHGRDKSDKIGFIAQEVEKIIPEVVITTKTKASNDETVRVDNQKSVTYQNIVPVLVEAIKELSAKVDDLEKRLGDK